ncbi:MAG: transglycosylase domain-containing protein [Desulfocapsaceae bacterium]
MAVSKNKKPAAPSKRRKPYNERHIIGFMFGVGLVLTLFLGVLLLALDQLNIPGIRDVSQYNPPQATLILDRHGALVDRVAVENRIVVGLDKMPPLLPKAFVAAEDGRFYEHPGLDFFSVLRALINNIRQGGKSQGGSTITQQVAKGLLLTPEKTYMRKFKEAILAWRIDRMLSKDEIIYIYLNHIYLGEGAYGVEAAAMTYFDKHAAELNLGEIAVLAGLPQAPSRYSPIDHWEKAHQRQRYVLNRMAADGYVSESEANAAYNIAPKLMNPAHRQGVNGYYLQVVRKRAEKMIGGSLKTAGLKIYTNLDQGAQLEGQRAVRAGVAAVAARNSGGNGAPEAALVALDGCSGRIRALIGGTDFSTTQFNRAVQAKRPAGSVFKPLVYSAALEKGWSTDTVIVDEPLSIRGADGKSWQPKNFSGKNYGPVSLRRALIYSYNIPAVKTMQKTGVKPVHQIARAAGITTELPPDLSLALGAVDVSPLEMSAAYQPFVCEGAYTLPTLIESITTHGGEKIYQHKPKRNRVMTSGSAGRVKSVLTEVISRGTGKRAAGVTGLIGGKTGTSDDNRDAWFIGFQNQRITGVWVGHDRNQSLGRAENGGRTAAPIWRNYMSRTGK